MSGFLASFQSLSTSTQVILAVAAAASVYGLHRGYSLARVGPADQQKKLGSKLAVVSGLVLATVVAYVAMARAVPAPALTPALPPMGVGSSAFDLPPPPPVGEL